MNENASYKKIINRETKLYLFFGILTTGVNYTSFLLAIKILGYSHPLIANIFSFIAATLFAFVTNKIWVFNCKSKGKNVLIEFVQFVFARIATLLVEQAGFLFCLNVLKADKEKIFGVQAILIAKVLLSFVSVILNYFASKFLVFKKESIHDESANDNSSI